MLSQVTCLSSLVSSTLGPARRSSGGQFVSYFLKLSMKRSASWRYFFMYSASLGQDCDGFRTFDGISSQLFGILKPKIGSMWNSLLAKPPLSAVLSRVRVYAMLIRFPTPYGPPVQPVFTSQQFGS